MEYLVMWKLMLVVAWMIIVSGISFFVNRGVFIPMAQRNRPDIASAFAIALMVLFFSLALLSVIYIGALYSGLAAVLTLLTVTLTYTYTDAIERLINKLPY
jgi:hypothetical protein